MRLKHSFIAVIFILIFAYFHSSCNKDKLTTATGFMLNSGPFANGGCEWIIVTPLGQFQPTNLPPAFRVDSLPVEITYRILRATADCPLPQNYAGAIHLNRIKQL